MSVMIDGCGLRMSSVAEVARRVVLAERPRVVVVSVDEGTLLVEGPGAGQKRLAGRTWCRPGCWETVSARMLGRQRVRIEACGHGNTAVELVAVGSDPIRPV